MRCIPIGYACVVCIVLGSNVKILQLFPISVYGGSVDVPVYIYDNLVQYPTIDIVQYNTSEIDGQQLVNGRITTNKSVLDDTLNSQLNQQVMNCIDEYTKEYYNIKLDGAFYITRSWVLHHDPGHWSQPHTHPNSVISGVMYLNCDPKSGDIKFHKPENYYNHLNTGTLKFAFNDYHEATAEVWFLTPNVGDIYLFPSHLTHSVGRNESNITRVSLSFDVFVEGIIDSGDPVTTLRLQKA